MLSPSGPHNSDEKSAIIQIAIPLEVTPPFSLVAFNIMSLPLVFRSLIMISLSMDFF